MKGITLCCLMGVVCYTSAAPVPTPKPKKVPVKSAAHFVGSWRMAWHGGSGDTIFYKDGGYWCLWSGGQWVGHWKLDGKKLTVTEGRIPNRPDGVPEAPTTWIVDLDDTGLAGVCRTKSGTGNFKLEK